MKLARINHERCGEIDCSTFVWIPDEMTAEEFEEIVYKAVTDYTKFCQSFKQVESPNDWASYKIPDYKNHPDKTVSEVEEIWASKGEVYKAWEAELNQAKQPFSKYLEPYGVIDFWAYEDYLTAEANWNHNHGTNLDYHQKRMKDLPGPFTKEKPQVRTVKIGRVSV